MQQILDFLEKSKMRLDDISNIFVNQGPGNFSGLRGSLAVAKGISLSKNISLYGYNTFLWSCSKFFNKKDNIYSLIKFNNKYKENDLFNYSIVCKSLFIYSTSIFIYQFEF